MVRAILATFLFLCSLVPGALGPSLAVAQEPAQQQNTQDQPKQDPSTVAPATKPTPANQNSQPQSQPGLTAKEKQNIEHEEKTGTSKDRLFWALPNFLSVDETENLPALTSGQKFKVVGRSLIDPSEFVLIGFVAGLGQASNSDPSYGQGAEGYGKRYATAYADNAIENFMASAVLPSLLHQDPRYYELGHGGFRRRTAHAISRIFITRSDSGQKQFNYSEVFGAGIAASISTYSYHPSSDKNFGTVANVWATQIGWDAATYLLKEFWPDLRRRHHKDSANNP
jgi:hypothetical protein